MALDRHRVDDNVESHRSLGHLLDREVCRGSTGGGGGGGFGFLGGFVDLLALFEGFAVLFVLGLDFAGPGGDFGGFGGCVLEEVLLLLLFLGGGVVLEGFFLGVFFGQELVEVLDAFGAE